MMLEICCKAVLFDMDGTLVDSTACVEGLWGGWAAKNHVDLKYLLSVSHGRRSADTIRDIAPHLDAEAEAKALELLELDARDGIVAVGGALETLQALHPSRWAVVTSATRALATTRLAAAGLPVPDVLIGAENVAHGKPDPEGYLKGAAALGFAPEDCVVVEDTPAGLNAGRAAGMRVLAITTTFPAEQLLGADAVLDYTGVRFVIESEAD
jgi:mannitol-1-/sugar-/sorbitol-6-phosphatase